MNNRAGIVATRHPGQGRVFHLPFDIPDVARADRAGHDFDDRCVWIGLWISQLDQAEIGNRAELHKLQSAHRSVPRKVLSGLELYCPAATIDVEVVVDQAR
jgi:hypothetical protein